MVTPGEFDHRPSMAQVPLPASLAGLRCLDVGTHDGFWAYEMERRGAAEVVAADIEDPNRIDWPGVPPTLSKETLRWIEQRRSAYDIAHEALGSKVDRRDISVYDLTVDRVGTFDFAFLGTLLHHLRDPIGALMGVRRVVTGHFVVTAVISISKTLEHPRQPILELLGQPGQPYWETPNLAALRQQFVAAGWAIDEITRPFIQHYGAGWSTPSALGLDPRTWKWLPRRILFHNGSLHVAVRAHPA